MALSPDGSAVAIGRRDQNGSGAVWLHDLVRESESRLAPHCWCRANFQNYRLRVKVMCS